MFTLIFSAPPGAEEVTLSVCESVCVSDFYEFFTESLCCLSAVSHFIILRAYFIKPAELKILSLVRLEF